MADTGENRVTLATNQSWSTVLHNRPTHVLGVLSTLLSQERSTASPILDLAYHHHDDRYTERGALTEAEGQLVSDVYLTSPRYRKSGP